MKIIDEHPRSEKPRSGKRLIMASPRGFCAGVRRAVEVAEAALLRHGRPIYCLNEIVHNRQVVEHLAARGVIFVRDIETVPSGGILLFSAHGVPPAIRQKAAENGLRVIDATCPFVNKVHEEVKSFAARDYCVFLIGKRDHDEVVGVAGEAPRNVTVVETLDDVRNASPFDTSRVAAVTQTTLNEQDAASLITALADRFPALETPRKSDICYATRNRQEAVRAVARQTQFMLVLGSENSSNSQRLVEVALGEGVPAVLLSDISELAARVPGNVHTLGLTAGASMPDDVIAEAVERLRTMGFTDIIDPAAAETNGFRDTYRESALPGSEE